MYVLLVHDPEAFLCHSQELCYLYRTSEVDVVSLFMSLTPCLTISNKLGFTG